MSVTLAFGLASLIPGCATAQVETANKPVSTIRDIDQTIINDLSFRDVMRAFYSGSMRHSNIKDEYIDSIPKEGFIEIVKVDDSLDDGFIEGFEPKGYVDRTLAVMHPVIQYKNVRGEQRYLVIIEKFQILDDSSYKPSWMADSQVSLTATEADLYSFKKLSEGQFQLVSKSLESIHYSGRPYPVNLQDANIPGDLQPLGNNLIGVIYETTQMRQGYTDSWLSVLLLPEDDFIGAYSLGDGGADNAGRLSGKPDEDIVPEDSPLYYNYDATLTVIPDGSKYYPIIKRFEGERPADSEVDFIGRDFVWQFNPEKKEYKSHSPEDIDNS